MARPFDEALALRQIDLSAVSETDEMRWGEMEQRTPGRVEARRRVVSDCHFRKTATEYDGKPGIKWLSCTAK
jgi:hypothetical protein